MIFNKITSALFCPYPYERTIANVNIHFPNQAHPDTRMKEKQAMGHRPWAMGGGHRASVKGLRTKIGNGNGDPKCGIYQQYQNNIIPQL